MFRSIDGSVRPTIAAKINLLKTSPTLRGKPLQDELQGYYRIVAAGRYRAIYRIAGGYDPEKHLGRVEVVCIGIRKEGSKEDIYYIAKRMIDSGDIA